MTLIIPDEKITYWLTPMQREFVLRAIEWLRDNRYEQTSCDCPHCEHCKSGAFNTGVDLVHSLASLLPEAQCVSQGYLGDANKFHFVPRYRAPDCPGIVLQKARHFSEDLQSIWREVCDQFSYETEGHYVV